MRIAALYDIHGNLPALEAVLRDVEQAAVDAVVLGGDVIPGPMSSECLDLLAAFALPVRGIHGNGEREILNIMAGREPVTVPPAYRPLLAWVAQQLNERQREWMSAWPLTHTEEVGGVGPVLFCHATTRNDTEIFTRNTPTERLSPIFGQLNVAAVVCGHTHMQDDRMVDRVRVINAGSVGMPFGPPGAYWLLLGPDVELRHTSYDLRAAAARVLATPYPEARSFAEREILQPRSEEATLALFDPVSL